MIKLTLTEKGGEPKVLTFDKDEITIGRVSGNDIVLAKGNVSKRHSRLALRGGQIEVSDLRSTNGTYVNGRKIAGPTMLSPSDRVYVGDFLIGIEGGGGAGAAAFAGDGAVAPAPGGSSGSRRMPVPPPPPPPRAGGSAPRPALEDDDVGIDEEDQPGLAARPPRPTKVPVPPPPPRRPPTPLASRALDQALDDEGLGSDLPPSADEVGGANLEDTSGGLGLFAHSRRPERSERSDEDGEVSTRRAPTGNRPGVAPPPPAAPAFAERGVTGPQAPVGDASGAAPAFEALLADPGIRHILLTGPDAALLDRGAGLTLHDDSLGDPNAVADALWRYANTAYPPPAPDNPVVDVRLPDGTHLSAIFPPAAPAGLVASVRRASLPAKSLVDLVPGANKDVESLLTALVAARRNVLVTGDAAALPSALGAIAGAIPPDRRVLSIGAGAQGRMGWTDLAPTADMPGLVRVAATLRPDHLVVGEVSGPEVGELALVAARGAEGLVVAVPGRAPVQVLARLAALAGAALGAPAAAAPLVASAFDVVVHVATTPEGGARIVEISEPRASGGDLAPEVALSLHSEGGKRDAGAGRLQGRGVSARLGAALAAAGSPAPSALVGK
jgi:pilus assembly protein CpaF